MKKIFLIALITFSHFFVFGQQKKPNKNTIPPPIKKKEYPMPEAKRIEDIFMEQTKRCFIYKVEERKDSLLYVSSNLLEYGWAGDNARMVISSYNYDPIKKKEAEQKGYVLLEEKNMQFINGSYKTEKDVLIFTPEKEDRFEKRTFKLVYKPKTNKVDYLKDEKNNKYIAGDCQEPILGQ
ncbi:hypothetical protein [Sphingobacterium detergens]|uniref:Uncharacterized protein n=1 Tax=Sphingobacterium detergens TaxID=1145106 RepID=A0A420BHA3_SPHD1|nr:hypothetical protein [Sphingobacterium detergens]RKE56080.1 hypothetical protein DFQ12_0932 [Sphingobacterium detergens]